MTAENPPERTGDFQQIIAPVQAEQDAKEQRALAWQHANVAEFAFMAQAHALIVAEALEHITPACAHGEAWHGLAGDHAEYLTTALAELIDRLFRGDLTD